MLFLQTQQKESHVSLLLPQVGGSKGALNLVSVGEVTAACRRVREPQPAASFLVSWTTDRARKANKSSSFFPNILLRVHELQPGIMGILASRKPSGGR